MDPMNELELNTEVDIEWSAMSEVEFDTNSPEPTKLAPPCKAFNEDRCLLSPQNCPDRHVCSKCKQTGHSAAACSYDVEPEEATSPRNRRGFVWEEDDISYSPCAKASLTAAPLPRPPLDRLMPAELLKTIKNRPDLFKIVTPINVDLFECLLAKHPNRRFVKSVIEGLVKGFWPFADVPYNKTIDESSSPPPSSGLARRQRRLKPEHRKFLEEQLDKEIKAGRFSTSFGKRLLPGMTCMPVVVSGKKKLRLIYNHSAGNYSLNSLIPENVRAVKADGIPALLRVLLHARALAKKKDLVLFKSDVSLAYRNMPMHPYWQALQAVQVNGQYYIDRCNTFGNAASQRIFCAFFSLVLWIAENVFDIHDILSYIDDNFSWEYNSRKHFYKPYNKDLPAKQAKLLVLWDQLGIPHEEKKQEFGPILTIIGFEVNLKRSIVTLPEATLKELLEKIATFCSPISRTTLNEFRRISGLVNWALDVNPLLCLGVTHLHSEMAGKDQPQTPCVVTDDIKRGLTWLARHLKTSQGLSFVRSVAWGSDEATMRIYTDATLKGFGFWPHNTKEAWHSTFPSDYPGVEIRFWEVFAVACAIYWAKGRRDRSDRLLIYNDSQSAIYTFRNLRSSGRMHRLLLFAADNLIEGKIDLRIELVKGKENKIADLLSRGKTEKLSSDYPNLRLREFAIPRHIAEILESP